MNFADIETMWRSPHNRPAPDQIEKDKMQFATELRRRHRGFVIFLTWIFAVLTLVTGRLVFHALENRATADGIAISREWGAILLLALPWSAALYFAWQHRRHRSAHGNGDSTIRETLRALLDENRLARVRLKIIAGLHGGLLIVLPIVAGQLRAVGKAGDEMLLPTLVIWPVIALGIVFALWVYDRRKLQPKARQLKTLLQAYE